MSCGGTASRRRSPRAGPGGDADWSRTRPLELARGQDAVVCPQGLADEAAELARRLPAGCALVVDCYAPALVERALLVPGDLRFAAFRRRVLGALERADLLLVANQPQRAYVAGMLSALGRVAPERTPPPVLLAPMGAPPPQPAGRRPRLAPRALVRRALAVVRRRDGGRGVRASWRATSPAARLRILGGRHPRGEAPDSLDAVLAAATTLWRARSRREPPLGRAARAAGLLAQASCALCLAHDGIEHRLAQRTRLLDLLSAGVPFVCTQGDSLGARAVEAGAATAVPAGDSAPRHARSRALLGDSTARHAQSQAGRALAAELAPARTLADAVAWLAAPQAGSAREAHSRPGGAARSATGGGRGGRTPRAAGRSCAPRRPPNSGPSRRSSRREKPLSGMRRSSETARRCSRTAGTDRAAEERACSFWGSQPPRTATASSASSVATSAGASRASVGAVVGREHEQAIALEVEVLDGVAAELVVVPDARLGADHDAQARQPDAPGEVGVLAVEEDTPPRSRRPARKRRRDEQAGARGDRDLGRRPGGANAARGAHEKPRKCRRLPAVLTVPSGSRTTPCAAPTPGSSSAPSRPARPASPAPARCRS